MDVTMESVRSLIDLMPGYVVVYQIRDGIHRLGYTQAVPELSGYTPEEYEQISQADASALIYEEDRTPTLRRLQEAIREQGEIHCGYRVVKKDGSLIRVNVRAREIGKMDGAPVVLTLLSKVTLDELQLDMLNRVPVGMGIYEVENGIPSLIFLNDSYYQMMGVTREERTDYLGSATINAVHPDDRAAIYEGIQKVLRGTTHHFRAVIRMLTNVSGEWHWLQLEGRIAKQHGAVSTFYLSFTKIDALQKAEAELRKSRAFMQSAMDAANIQYFEYYPAEHVAVGHDTSAKFDLPQRVEDYPESLIRSGVFHPDDIEGVRAFFAKVDSGATPAHWEGRIRAHGRYRWFSCVMTSSRDVAQDRLVVAATLFDITVQKEAQQSYRSHLDSILRANPDAISTFRMNVTGDVCEDGYSIYENILRLKDGGSVGEFFAAAEQYIPDEDGRARFHAAFAREAVLASFAQGQKKITVEHRYRPAPQDTEWITTTMDLMKNPTTGDVEAVLYSVNTNAAHMERDILHNILLHTYDAVAVVDRDTDEFFLYERQGEAHGRHFSDFTNGHDKLVRSFLSDEDWAALEGRASLSTVNRELAAHGCYSVNFFIHTPQGLRRKRLSYRYIDKGGHTLLAALRDFSDNDLLEQFRYSSDHDPVTDLYNRQKTFAECRKMLDAHPEQEFYLCHMDIQRFRLINSFYGEAEGDALLRAIGRQLAGFAENYPCAVYGRIESDVFCICVPQMRQEVERDTRRMKQWLRGYRSDFVVEANFGAYEINNRTLPLESMFTRATLAAKHSRGAVFNHFAFFTDKMEDALQKEQQISNEMHQALAQEQFKVYLQPKYILKSSLPCGAEALVRWEHPVKGLISPGEFIPLFEKNGFILQLDRYMWEQVCILLRRWLDAGEDPAPISVNVSRVSMYSPSTVGYLHDLTEKYRLPRALMQLELTESAYMDDPEEMKKRLRALQADGFAILMDDFGSGYSSLNTLRELPVDYLKLDVRFLADTGDDERSRLILASVVRMACWLNLPVITEGVETTEQKDFLNGIGCTYAQGFLFARPMPVAEYEQRILRQHKTAPSVPALGLTTVAGMVADVAQTTHLLAESLPMPLAFVDVTGREFSYLRANQEFQQIFGFDSDIIDKEQLLKDHLSGEDYEFLMNAYHRAAATKGKAECRFHWRCGKSDQRCYLMQARYLGESSYSAVLLAAFVELSPCEK